MCEIQFSWNLHACIGIAYPTDTDICLKFIF